MIDLLAILLALGSLAICLQSVLSNIDNPMVEINDRDAVANWMMRDVLSMSVVLQFLRFIHIINVYSPLVAGVWL